MATIGCIEVDNEGKYILCGGSTKLESSGEGIITAYTFDKKLKQTAVSLVSDVGTKCISKLVRMKDTNKLFAGVNHTIVVFEFVPDNKFNVIGKVRMLNGNSRITVIYRSRASEWYVFESQHPVGLLSWWK